MTTTNNQGRKRGKSVSFRGQSNDSNFYDNRPRNDAGFFEGKQRNFYRDDMNNEDGRYGHGHGHGHGDLDSRVVTLLPDANMTISVQNDFRGSSGRGRYRGSRGILKSHSFHDDTNIYNRSSDFHYRDSDDYSGSGYSKRGFEAYQGGTGGGGRGRNRPRGFHYNRQNHHQGKQYPQEGELDSGEKEQRDNYYDGGSGGPRGGRGGRSSSGGERSRRYRGGRGRGNRGGRGSNNRNQDEHSDGPTSGDGDKEDTKEGFVSVDNETFFKTDETEESETHIQRDDHVESSPKEVTSESSEIPKTEELSDTPVVDDDKKESEDNKNSEEKTEQTEQQ